MFWYWDYFRSCFAFLTLIVMIANTRIRLQMKNLNVV